MQYSSSETLRTRAPFLAAEPAAVSLLIPSLSGTQTRLKKQKKALQFVTLTPPPLHPQSVSIGVHISNGRDRDRQRQRAVLDLPSII